VRFSWYTPYNNVENQTASNELWDKISSSHGLIALNHHIAKENQWLESMPVPGDEGKGLYLLESYHQLHCLVSPASPPPRRHKSSEKLMLRVVENRSHHVPREYRWRASEQAG
jgi:hypothetical protein